MQMIALSYANDCNLICKWLQSRMQMIVWVCGCVGVCVMYSLHILLNIVFAFRLRFDPDNSADEDDVDDGEDDSNGDDCDDEVEDADMDDLDDVSSQGALVKDVLHPSPSRELLTCTSTHTLMHTYTHPQPHPCYICAYAHVNAHARAHSYADVQANTHTGGNALADILDMDSPGGINAMDYATHSPALSAVSLTASRAAAHPTGSHAGSQPDSDGDSSARAAAHSTGSHSGSQPDSDGYSSPDESQLSQPSKPDVESQSSQPPKPFVLPPPPGTEPILGEDLGMSCQLSIPPSPLSIPPPPPPPHTLSVTGDYVMVLIDRSNYPGEIDDIFFAIDETTGQIDKSECPMHHMHMSMPIPTYVYTCDAHRYSES